MNKLEQLTDSQVLALFRTEFRIWPEPSTPRRQLEELLREHYQLVVDSIVYEPFDLPEGYCAIIFSSGVHGGIGPDGRIST